MMLLNTKWCKQNTSKQNSADRILRLDLRYINMNMIYVRCDMDVWQWIAGGVGCGVKGDTDNQKTAVNMLLVYRSDKFLWESRLR